MSHYRNMALHCLFLDAQVKSGVVDQNMTAKESILMVCLGNSCRSPIAEAVFRDELKRRDLLDNWEVDSAALLQYHVGKNPEPRAISTLRNAGIVDYSHQARLIKLNDFYKFNWIFGMDSYIVHELYKMKPKDSNANIAVIGEYDPQGEREIRDPLFDNDSTGFEKAFEQSVRSIKAFLDNTKFS